MSPAKYVHHGEELLRLFHIGSEDLEANRVGTLGPRQRQRLARSAVWNLVGAVGIAVALVAIVLLVADKPLKPVSVVITAVLAAAALITGVVMFQRTNVAAAAGVVECISGPAHAQMRGKAGWYLNVEGRSFRLPVQFRHMQNGAPYHVYFTPKANRVVAMEPDGWS